MSQKLQINFTVEVFDELNQLSSSEQELWKAAQKAAADAYAPYSGFLVGAAILLEDGSIYTGNNQENAAYPSGLCAERTALFHLGSLNSGKKIKMIAVTARKQNETDFVPVTPCGACRQVMAEYENKQGQEIKILMQKEENQFVVCQSSLDLLPLQFSKRSLLID